MMEFFLEIICEGVGQSQFQHLKKNGLLKGNQLLWYLNTSVNTEFILGGS